MTGMTWPSFKINTSELHILSSEKSFLNAKIKDMLQDDALLSKLYFRAQTGKNDNDWLWPRTIY